MMNVGLIINFYEEFITCLTSNIYKGDIVKLGMFFCKLLFLIITLFYENVKVKIFLG